MHLCKSYLLFLYFCLILSYTYCVKNKEIKEKKSIEKIHEALALLIKKNGYDNINVSDIIKESGVSRSTFYTYYKSKDDVLDKLSDHIFSHVFSNGLTKEEGHDFSTFSIFDYKHLIEHIFYHFKEERELIGAIFNSSASHRFIHSLEEEVKDFMKLLVLQNIFTSNNIPENIATSQYTSGLIELLKYYTIQERKETPEEMCSYFFSLYQK